MVSPPSTNRSHWGESAAMETEPTIEMGEIIDICKYVLRDVAVFLQTEFKYLEGHRFIL